MDNIYSYKEGFREGVIFAFVDDNKILLEIRDDKKSDIFFPNGSIEEKDKLYDENYIIKALKREIFEEFDAHIDIQEYSFVSKIAVKDINVLFYIFLITYWKGTFPKYTIEDGEPFAELIWVDIDDVELFIPYSSGKNVTDEIKKHMKFKKIDARGVLNNKVFTYRITKNKKVFIFWHNIQAKILSGRKANDFIEDIKSVSEKDAQLIMAKLTGNFKRGNEKNIKKD